MRRINTIEYILSVVMSLVIPFLLKGDIVEHGHTIKYGFGFPCTYVYIYQTNETSINFFNNFFCGNNGININILGFFINTIIYYLIIKFLKKMYISSKKFTNK